MKGGLFLYLNQRRLRLYCLRGPKKLFIIATYNNIIFLYKKSCGVVMTSGFFENAKLTKKTIVSPFTIYGGDQCEQRLFVHILTGISQALLFYKFNAIKTIGVGYQFILAKAKKYFFILVGLTHLIPCRYGYSTDVFSLQKKRKSLILRSERLANKNDCTSICRQYPIDKFCGKGIKLFNTKIQRKAGKKSLK
jgi:hypothetical protein